MATSDPSQQICLCGPAIIVCVHAGFLWDDAADEEVMDQKLHMTSEAAED